MIRTFMNSKIHRARVTESNLNYVGKMCLNGAASRLVEVGDVIIIMTYAQLNEDEMVNYSPKVAVLNENNEIIEMINEKENTISNV
ncbi:MAG: aspartate 1-decarboxylase [Staphylococcus epidermidis]|nr:aspartate 1-decarboxylase [Staphylococcus epidermidis]